VIRVWPIRRRAWQLSWRRCIWWEQDHANESGLICTRTNTETLLSPKVDPLIGYLATDEECEIGFRGEDSRIDTRERDGDLGGGIKVFIAWNSSATRYLDK